MSAAKESLNRQYKQIKAIQCKRNYSEFVKEFWSIIVPGDELVFSPHIKEICDVMQQLGLDMLNGVSDYDLIINVPPGSTKSTTVTIMWNAWLWTIMPHARVMTGSNDSKLADDHSSKTSDIIQSQKYQDFYPNIRLRTDVNSKSHFKNTLQGERMAFGIHSASIGFHAHVNIIDDPITPTGADKEHQRKNANTYFSKVLPTRKVDKIFSPTVLVMQRLNVDDPTALMLKKKSTGRKIKHIKLPAKATGDIQPPELIRLYTDGFLDPIRMGQDVLDKMEVDLGTVDYSGQFEQEPIRLEGNLLKTEWFEIIDMYELPDEVLEQVVKFNGDTATKIKTKNDPSGILAYTSYQHDLYLIEWINKRLEFPDLLKEIKTFVERIGSKQSLIYIEPKSSGSSVVQQARVSTNLNILEYKMTEGDKVARVTPCIPYCQAGRVKIVKGSWNKEFIDQITLFPNHPHDEAIDNLSMAVTQELIRGGSKPSTGRSWART